MELCISLVSIRAAAATVADLEITESGTTTTMPSASYLKTTTKSSTTRTHLRHVRSISGTTPKTIAESMR